jgi:hypothetical protein
MHKTRTLLSLAAIGFTLAIGAVAFASQISAAPSGAVSHAEYQNDRWHFSLAVPSDMTVNAYDQAGGQTMQFLDADGNFQFEITAWPYSQLDLTSGREGTPSETWDQPNHLEIVDVFRDDLFTVVFVKNGLRYAIVTLPEYEAALIDILKTWSFTP